MRFRPMALWLLAAATLLLPLSALASQGYEVEFQGEDQGKTRVVVLRVDADHLRVSSQGENEEIVLGPEGFTVIKHDEKMIYTMTYEQLEGMMSGMGKMMEGLEAMKEQQVQALKDARDGTKDADAKAALDVQIAEMEKEMGKADIPRITFEPNGKSETVAGMKVKGSVVREGDEVKGTIWTTDKIPTGHIMAAAKRVVDILPGPMKEQIEWSDMLISMPGFPLKVQSEEMTAEAVRVDKMEFGADAWTQEGYESGAFPMMGGMGGMGGN